MTWARINNTVGNEHCRFCIDGWVELKGTLRVHGYEYSRGSAPCKFCELGLKRWARMKDKRVPVDDSYTITDVSIPTEDTKPLPRHEAKLLIGELMRQARPPIVEKTETSGDIKRRIDAARDALQDCVPVQDEAKEAAQTQSLEQAGTQEPFAPPDDDIPF